MIAMKPQNRFLLDTIGTTLCGALIGAIIAQLLNIV